MVRLRITAHGENEATLRNEIEAKVDELKTIIGDYIYGYENDQLEELIGRILKEKKATVVTAESCTGGYIAHRITSIAGSSEYYKGSVVPYSNELKVSLLKVEQELITKHGAVSEPVVRSMAENGRLLLNADYCIATSGIAGPTGGSEEKPVGTVWIAISGPNETRAWKVQLGSNRLRIISETALHALNGLRKQLIAE
jgi:nicotinamide-nucleotide amidase